ncbi:hypothetical protein CPB84DRAFT_1689472 [Gymnopilus junonius]|uniref:Uncharacterized protein n=1 Tax=Gymnopilus junonius TaxID=109634 RepID=A0A9P5NAC4_GYMJU|nr:hypothetical protein CPB84DRAFT_1689472 [Gymnopilus junonius]
MPATRSSSSQPRSHPFTASSPHTYISLSSSDGDSPRAPLKPMRQNRPQPALRPKKAVFIPPPEEVIEISSDDEEYNRPVTSQATMVADFRRQINKLREESVKHKRDFDRASKQLKELKEENQVLQALRKPNNGQILLVPFFSLQDVEELSEQLDCEICSSRMWTPYMYAKFLTEHPENVPQPLHRTATLNELTTAITQNPQLVLHQGVVDMIIQLLPPGPKYTCPACREPVRSRPTEAFSLKALVRTIAAAAGESSPKKSTLPGRKATGVASSPWDGFFPSRAT